MAAFKVVTIRMTEDLHRKVRHQLVEDGTSFQRKVIEELEKYVLKPVDAKAKVGSPRKATEDK